MMADRFVLEVVNPRNAMKTLDTQPLAPRVKTLDGIRIALILEKPDGMNLAKLAAAYSDGIILGSADVPSEITDFCKNAGHPILPYNAEALADGSYMDDYNSFYDKL